MTADEFAALKAECDRRNFNITPIVALANIMPLLGVKTKYRGTNKEKELTYCGKTRREWGNVKRRKLSPAEREELRKWQIN